MSNHNRIKFAACPACDGLGYDETDQNNYCRVCNGTGRVYISRKRKLREESEDE